MHLQLHNRGHSIGTVLRRGLTSGLIVFSSMLVSSGNVLSNTYSIFDLGDLPGGLDFSATSAITNEYILGFSMTSNSPQFGNRFGFEPHPVLWSLGANTARDLASNLVNLSSSGQPPSLINISNNGIVLGSFPTSPLYPFTLNTTTNQTAIVAGHQNYLSPQGINNNNAVVGSFPSTVSISDEGSQTVVRFGPNRPFISDQIGFRQLPINLSSNEAARAIQINDAGQIIGTSGNSAIFWNSADALPTIIRTAPFNFNIFATDLNSSGIVAGDYGRAFPENQTTAFRWTPPSESNAALFETMPLIPGTVQAASVGINNNGAILGTAFQSNSRSIIPFVWNSNGSVTNLNTEIGSSEWTITQVAGINDFGQIAATGTNGIVTHALLLTPSAIPPPNLTLPPTFIATGRGYLGGTGCGLFDLAPCPRGYRLNVEGGEITFGLKLNLVGDEPPPEVLAAWENGISEIWSDQYQLVDEHGAAYKISFDVDFVADDWDFRISGHMCVRGTDDCRANVISWTFGEGFDIEYHEQMAAHEFGHIVGLRDEYEDILVNGVLQSVILEEFSSNPGIMSTLFAYPQERNYRELLSHATSVFGSNPSLVIDPQAGQAPIAEPFNFADVHSHLEPLDVPEPSPIIILLLSFIAFLTVLYFKRLPGSESGKRWWMIGIMAVTAGTLILVVAVTAYYVAVPIMEVRPQMFSVAKVVERYALVALEPVFMVFDVFRR